MTSEKNIIERIRLGEPAVFRKIYSSYFPSITKYILNNQGSLEDAKDVFQDAIMVIYEKSKDPSFTLNASIHTYLFAISKNLWLKNIRKNLHKKGSLPEELELIENDSFESEIQWREKEKLYRTKFSLLDDICKKIITLFLQKKTMVEIATELGLSSPAYAKKRKYKCKLKLLQSIKSDPSYKSLES